MRDLWALKAIHDDYLRAVHVTFFLGSDVFSVRAREAVAAYQRLVARLFRATTQLSDDLDAAADAATYGITRDGKPAVSIFDAISRCAAAANEPDDMESKEDSDEGEGGDAQTRTGLGAQRELQTVVGRLCDALFNFEEAHGGAGGLLISERQASSSIAHEVLATRLSDYFLSHSGM